VAFLGASLCTLAVPARALYRIDTFAGEGYGDGGPAIAAAVVSPADAVTDSAGNVYFTDQGDQLVRRVDATTGTITTVAGNGSPGFSGDGGPAILASLHDPDGVALDPGEQHLYVVDYTGARVRRIDLVTNVITTFAGTGVVAGSIDGEGGNPADDVGNGGPALTATFNQPIGVAVAANGDVYISERDEDHPVGVTHHPRIRRVDHTTGIITMFAGGLPEDPFNGDGKPALETSFADPIGLEFDAGGNLYVGELGNHRVRRIAAGTTIVSTIAGTGSFDEGPQPFSGDGGPATAAGLDRPVRFSLWPTVCGGAGGPPCQFLIGDSLHHCVRWVDAEGIIHTVVNTPPTPTTTPTSGDAGDGGPAAAALLETPAVAPGPGDAFLVIDDAANRLRIVGPASDPTHATIRAFAGTGEGGFAGDGGPATRALLDRPTGLAVDAAGNVYVTEHDDFRVRRIAADATRTITTFAGNGERGGGGDGGPAVLASFEQATGITYTPAGDFLIADAGAQTVRRIDASGTISAFAGQTDVEGFAGDGGPATAAVLDTPLRTVVTSAGDVLIADFNNNRIRRVAGATGVITTFVAGLNQPAGLVLASDGTLYVANFGAQQLLAVDPDGTVHVLAGTGVETGSIDGEGGNPSDDLGDGGAAAAATFSEPTGLAFDRDGSLLVTDQGNNRVRRLALDGTGRLSPASTVTTVIGDGRPTFGGDGGDALAASVSAPTEAMALADGRILVADRGNQRVRVATPVTSLCAVSCDDGDPCTVDTCDPARGCVHTPSPDTDGDGVCDAIDNCPTVPNPTQDPAACKSGSPPPPPPAAGACARGAPACIPGGGAGSSDCLVETIVQGGAGLPLVACTDGDPACDADPTPGRCGFTVSWCFNESDPRLACKASGVRRVTVHVNGGPRSSARSLTAGILGVVGSLGSNSAGRAALVFGAPLASADRCTPAMTVTVGVRGHTGHLRPGHVAIAVTAKGAARLRDTDRLRLVCRPAS
jgi:sugar lactone lactonase YvrE